METNEKQPVDLPENAFRELKPGEESISTVQRFRSVRMV